MLDKAVPEKTVKFANKPLKPWFNMYIRDQRKNCQEQRLCLEKVQTSMASLHIKERHIHLPAYLPGETSHFKPNK